MLNEILESIDSNSIFEQNVEVLTETTLVNNYQEFISKLPELGNPFISGIRDHNAIQFLIEKFNLKQYMITPTALFEGKLITAQTIKVFDFYAGLNYFAEFISGNKQIFLYDVSFHPAMPQYYSLDPKTFEKKDFEYPIVDEESFYWKIRFGILQN